MSARGFHRLHALRIENDAAGFAMEAMHPRFAALASRHEDGTAPRAVSSFQLFQTPPAIAARLMALAGVVAGSRVLEPSAGLGRILDALPRVDAVAVEMAAQCAGELFRQDRAGVKIMQRDFLAVDAAETGLFDFVVMNPPFHMRADIQHIRHALTFLKPGGKLAALCLDTHHRETALRPLSATWENLPAGTFRAEGTNVATVLLTINA